MKRVMSMCLSLVMISMLCLSVAGCPDRAMAPKEEKAATQPAAETPAAPPAEQTPATPAAPATK